MRQNQGQSMPDFGTPKKEIDFVAMDVETATTKGGICQIGIVTVIAGEITEEKQFMVRPPETNSIRSTYAYTALLRIKPNVSLRCLQYGMKCGNC